MTERWIYDEYFLEVMQTESFEELTAYTACADKKSARLTEVHPSKRGEAQTGMRKIKCGTVRQIVRI
jgi:hypothetical protein